MTLFQKVRLLCQYENIDLSRLAHTLGYEYPIFHESLLGRRKDKEVVKAVAKYFNVKISDLRDSSLKYNIQTNCFVRTSPRSKVKEKVSSVSQRFFQSSIVLQQFQELLQDPSYSKANAESFLAGVEELYSKIF